MSTPLDHDRHTLVGKDSYGRVWKTDILLHRGVTIEAIELNGQSLEICLHLFAHPLPLTSTLEKGTHHGGSFQAARWQPGMGNGRIFAYCHRDSWIPAISYLFEVKIEFWVSAQGLHIKLTYQSEKSVWMGWQAHMQAQVIVPTNLETISPSPLHSLELSLQPLKVRKTSDGSPSTRSAPVKLLAIGSEIPIIERAASYRKTTLKEDSFLPTHTFTIATARDVHPLSYYQGTLELLFSLNP